MTDSALLKIDRAAKHVSDLNKLFGETRPFVLVLETSTDAKKRAIFPKRNEAIINKAGLMAGDAVHNIRSALGHAYWEIVSPRCTSDSERRKLQFPFCEKANRLDAAIQSRLAHYAGTGLYCALRRLRPHGDPGGNELLFLIHEMDVLDKHKLLIPTDEQMRLSSDVIRNLIPDFPFRFGENTTFTNCIMSWNFSGTIPLKQLGTVKPPTRNVFEREFDIPFDIVFRVGSLGSMRPVIPTLNALIDTTRQTIDLIREAAMTY